MYENIYLFPRGTSKIISEFIICNLSDIEVSQIFLVYPNNFLDIEGEDVTYTGDFQNRF